MNSPPEAHDAALLSRPLSLSFSPESPSLDTTSATTPTVLSAACGRQSSFAISRALSEATTAAFPLPPVPRTATLQLLPNHNLPSLLTKYQPPFALADRPLTASEAASELVSRGSCVQREEETMVDELLLETTQPFYGVLTPAATATTSAEEVEDEDAERTTATVTAEGSKDRSSSSRFSSPKDHRQNGSRPHGQRLARLDASTRSDVSESVETVESYDRQLRKIVSYELMSSPSLKLPSTAPAATAPLPQHLLSHCLHPVTQSDSRCFSNAMLSTPTGSPVATGFTAQTSFAMEPEEPRSLMHFPAFVGLLDTVRSHSARSARGGGGGHSASLRSNSKSRNGTSLQDTAVTTPLGPPVSLTAHLRKPSTTPATTTGEESTRGKRVPHCSLMADSSSHASGGISGVFPALSFLTVGSASANPAAAASGVAEAALSSVEVVAPCPTTPRSSREGSRSRRQFSAHTTMTATPINTAVSVSDVLCGPNFQPVGVNNASFTQSSMPFVPLPAPVPRHLYRVAQDGRASLEPMALEESGRRPSTSLIQAGDTPVHPSALIPISNLPLNTSVVSINGSSLRRFGALLPPLSPQVSSGGNVQEANVPSPRRATSAVCAKGGGRSGSSAFSSGSRRGTASSFSPTGSPMQRTPLLGRLFREPKGHQVRMWVRAGSMDSVPLPCNEQCDEHGS